MKRLSPELSAYLSLSIGIAIPIAYATIVKMSSGWLVNASFFGIVIGAVIGLVLGAVATDDKNQSGSLKIIVMLGIVLNALMLVGSLLLMGSTLSPSAKLF